MTKKKYVFLPLQKIFILLYMLVITFGCGGLAGLAAALIRLYTPPSIIRIPIMAVALALIIALWYQGSQLVFKLNFLQKTQDRKSPSRK